MIKKKVFRKCGGRKKRNWEEKSILQIKMVEQKEEIKCGHLANEDLDICSRPGKKTVVKC